MGIQSKECLYVHPCKWHVFSRKNQFNIINNVWQLKIEGQWLLNKNNGEVERIRINKNHLTITKQIHIMFEAEL